MVVLFSGSQEIAREHSEASPSVITSRLQRRPYTHYVTQDFRNPSTPALFLNGTCSGRRVSFRDTWRSRWMFDVILVKKRGDRIYDHAFGLISESWEFGNRPPRFIWNCLNSSWKNVPAAISSGTHTPSTEANACADTTPEKNQYYAV